MERACEPSPQHPSRRQNYVLNERVPFSVFTVARFSPRTSPVPTNNSDCVEIVDVQRSRLLIFPPHANRGSLFVFCSAFLPPKPRVAASGESCPAPPDQRTATLSRNCQGNTFGTVTPRMRLSARSWIIYLSHVPTLTY